MVRILRLSPSQLADHIACLPRTSHLAAVHAALPACAAHGTLSLRVPHFSTAGAISVLSCVVHSPIRAIHRLVLGAAPLYVPVHSNSRENILQGETPKNECDEACMCDMHAAKMHGASFQSALCAAVASKPYGVSLTCTHVNKKGLRQFLDALASNRNLQALSLSFLPIESSGPYACMPSMHTLHNTEPHLAATLASGLRALTGLRKLSLARLPDDTSGHITHALCTLSALSALRIAHTIQRNDIFSAILDVLPDTLQHLDLSIILPVQGGWGDESTACSVWSPGRVARRDQKVEALRSALQRLTELSRLTVRSIQAAVYIPALYSLATVRDVLARVLFVLGTWSCCVSISTIHMHASM